MSLVPSSLLINANAANGTFEFLDSSVQKLPIQTINAGPYLETSDVYSGTSAGFFSGYSTYIHVAANSTLEFLDADFTIEFFIKTTTEVPNAVIMCKGEIALYPGMWTLTINNSSPGDVAFFAGDMSPATPIVMTNGVTVADNRWHFIQIIRRSDTWLITIDGIIRGESFAYTYIQPLPFGYYIGADQNKVTNFYGYLDEIRISTGIGRWVGVGVYPNGSLIGYPYIPDGFVQFLMPFDGASGTNNFIDNNGNALTVYPTTSPVRISTTNSKFGSSSGYFPGAGGYLYIEQNIDALYFSNHEFSIECWFCPTNNANANSAIIATAQSWGDSSAKISFSSNSTIVLQGFLIADISSVTSLSLNTWYHIAVTKQLNQIRLFINGVAEVTVSDTNVWDFSAGGTTIGTDLEYGYDGFIAGYLDDLRVVKGYAVYWDNFTPPTSQLTPLANVTILDAIVVNFRAETALITSPNSTISNITADVIHAANPYAVFDKSAIEVVSTDQASHTASVDNLYLEVVSSSAGAYTVVVTNAIAEVVSSVKEVVVLPIFFIMM